jgi:hypothetical protein
MCAGCRVDEAFDARSYGLPGAGQHRVKQHIRAARDVCR